MVCTHITDGTYLPPNTCKSARVRYIVTTTRNDTQRRVKSHQKELVGPSIVVDVVIRLGRIPPPPPHLLLLFLEFGIVCNGFGLFLVVFVFVSMVTGCCCCYRLQLYRHPTVPPFDDLANPCLVGSFQNPHSLILPLIGRQQVERG